MISAPIPENEKRRLETLRRYQILDTAPEARFDDLTRLASQICKVPIALVSLVDENRQWFKSRIGLAAPETGRDVSFCAHAILNPQIFVVPDTHADERFVDNPLVEGEPPVRFYAGAPLVTPTGENVGTLCVIDRTPRQLTPEQSDALEVLARQVVAQMELHLQVSHLTDVVCELEQSRQELTEREEQLNHLTNELIRSNSELLDFTLVVSHDLQEPLRKIQTFGDRLRSKAKDTLTTDTRMYLDRMIDAANRMQTLINDLLAYSRVTTRAEPFKIVNLNKVLSGVVCDLEARIHATGGRIEADALPSLEADALQMRQLFQNLIGNALKFHREGVPPVVTISGTTDDTTLTLKFADNGIGFDQSYADRIFQVFERLGDSDKGEGTGVGLAICRKIVDRHGGTIRADSRVGEGTTFTITLPLGQKCEAAP